jgi:nicotinamidase-related amidase
MAVEAKGFMKGMKVGKWNQWYFDEILPGEEEIYNAAQEEYLAERHQWDIDPDRAVLLIIDLQNDFCDPEKGAFWLPANTKMMPRMKEMLAYCREVGIPVCFTAHQQHPSGRDTGLMKTYLASTIGAGALTEGTWGAGIYGELEPLPDEWVINEKRRYDAFIETGLDIWMKNVGPEPKDTIIMTGCCTNFCCSTTTRAGMQRDHKIAYPYDLNATDDAEVHEEIVKTMARGYARVQSSDAWIAEMKDGLAKKGKTKVDQK